MERDHHITIAWLISPHYKRYSHRKLHALKEKKREKTLLDIKLRLVHINIQSKITGVFDVETCHFGSLPSVTV